MLHASCYILDSTYFIDPQLLPHDAFIMSLQMPAPTPLLKVSRTRQRQKYSGARAFYLTILVISVIGILSLIKARRIQHDSRKGFHESSRVLVRRDLEVR